MLLSTLFENPINNTDRGAYVDLGKNFEFAAEKIYTLELSWENLSNAILFAGFAIDAPNVNAQMQTQRVNFALRARRITAGDTLATWKRVGGNNILDEGAVETEETGTAALTISTNALSDATFTVDGCDPVTIDLMPGYRYLWIGYEDPTSGTSDARLLGLTFRGSEPPPPPVLANVLVSPSSELIESGDLVTLETDVEEAEIYYTLDGSEPEVGTGAILYNEPFALTGSTVVKAVGLVDGVAGPVLIKSYALRQTVGTPNVVILVGRAIGMGDLQSYGGVMIATPALDRLAREGVRFTQYTTSGAGSVAAQYGLMSGRSVARSGLTGETIAPGAVGWQAEEWSLGEVLRKRGYKTAFIGEWLLGDAVGSRPQDQGFGLFYGLGADASTSPPLEENGVVVEAEPSAEDLLENLAARAESFVGVAQEPFGLIFQLPELAVEGDSPAGSHGDRVEALDAAVGRILAALDGRGVTEDTLVVFVSDGGAERGEEGGYNGVLRDGAGTTWEGGMRAPMLARLPGVLPSGTMSLGLEREIDVLPSLASLLEAEVAVDRPMDGKIRQDEWLGIRTRPAGDEVVFGLRFADGAWKVATVREGKWKLHLAVVNIDPENKRPTTPGQLYDLHVDAEERIDRAGEQAEVVEHLQGLAASWEGSLPAAGTNDLPAAKGVIEGEISTGFNGTTAVDFSFVRPADSLDDYFWIEHSKDLVEWAQEPIGPYVIERVPNEGFRESMIVRVPFGASPFDGLRCFVRMRASRPTSP